jgi:hypothetical protein
MDKRLFWRAALTQAVVVAVPLGLLALIVGEKFFRDNGSWVGPLAWILCSIGTALILKLPWALAAFAAVASGIASVVVMLGGAPHGIALLVAVGVFGACCGGYETALRELEEKEAEHKKTSDDASREPERDTTNAT